MTTIKDIAARLELSPSTVSIVLKGNGDRRKIKKETQQRIMNAAKEMCKRIPEGWGNLCSGDITPEDGTRD